MASSLVFDCDTLVVNGATDNPSVEDIHRLTTSTLVNSRIMTSSTNHVYTDAISTFEFGTINIKNNGAGMTLDPANHYIKITIPTEFVIT